MKRQNNLLILTLGVFSIINTEMGVIGILPMIAEQFAVNISTAGLLVSLFALGVAIAGPIMPLLFSGVNRKGAMILVLGIFLLCNLVSVFTTSFNILLIARILPALFHPIYVSLAFSVASSSVSPSDAPRAVAKVMMGVSAGMVLGVPIVSYIASTTSLQIAMMFFALLSGLSLLATIFFIPSLPVKEKMSYGSQLNVLRSSNTWISLVGVVLINGAIFGVYSYISEYLGTVTGVSSQFISVLLLVYGLANIVGNVIAGKMLSENPIRFVVSFPFLLSVVYLLLFFTGQFTTSAALLILVWGILSGAGANINQYWITSAAPDAPDFANGLFLSATNLGTTIGATICGFFITEFGTSSIILGGLCLLALSVLAILVRAQQQKVKYYLPRYGGITK